MQFLLYILIYPLLWLISILPFPILYLLSDFIYVILYHVIGYRKKIVRENLAMALPNLSEKERSKNKTISRQHVPGRGRRSATERLRTKRAAVSAA